MACTRTWCTAGSVNSESGKQRHRPHSCLCRCQLPHAFPQRCRPGWLRLLRKRYCLRFDYSLRRWTALTRFVDDGQLPVDNNWIENQIRPIAIGRNNWLFAGSLRAGQRAAAVMSLVQSARMNGHDPYAYLRDVLTRLPTHRASRVEELLPHRWQASSA